VRAVPLALSISLSLVSVSAFAQQCLHGTGETAEQTARRREALAATRTINNLQFNQPNAQKRIFFSHAQLAESPLAASMRANPNEFSKRISFTPDGEILPGWKLTLDLTADGYWFSISDKTDPCGFAYISNHAGVIYTSEPLR
jgi:hypothetical protein